MSETERVDELDRIVSGLVELVDLQAKRLNRLGLADNPGDVGLAEQAADQAKALARGGELAAANLG
jgi:hypothetical protein